eukprot:3232512-Pleurochrysis_carterae.AAC.1
MRGAPARALRLRRRGRAALRRLTIDETRTSADRQLTNCTVHQTARLRRQSREALRRHFVCS